MGEVAGGEVEVNERVGSAIRAMYARKLELQKELEAITIALDQFARFVPTPTKTEHARARLKHTPIPFRAERMAAGISATEFAAALGISDSYVSQIESGARRASSAVIDHWTMKLRELIEERNGRNGQQAKEKMG